MDITALSTSLSQANLQTAIGFELLANAQELAEVQTEAIQELISAIPTPGVGENIDISI